MMEQLRRDEPPDIWQMRDPLPKAWQDCVTMRLLVRGPLVMQQGASPCFAAKWHLPHQEAVQHFVITDTALVSCSEPALRSDEGYIA